MRCCMPTILFPHKAGLVGGWWPHHALRRHLCTDAISILHCKWRKAEFYTEFSLFQVHLRRPCGECNPAVKFTDQLRYETWFKIRYGIWREIFITNGGKLNFKSILLQVHLRLRQQSIAQFDPDMRPCLRFYLGSWSWVFKLQHNEQNQIKMLWISDS